GDQRATTRYSRPPTVTRSPGPNRRPRRRSTTPLTSTPPARTRSFAWPPVEATPAHFNASPSVMPGVTMVRSIGFCALPLPVDSHRRQNIEVIGVLDRAEDTGTERPGQLE